MMFPTRSERRAVRAVRYWVLGQVAWAIAVLLRSAGVRIWSARRSLSGSRYLLVGSRKGRSGVVRIADHWLEPARLMVPYGSAVFVVQWVLQEHWGVPLTWLVARVRYLL